MILIVALLVLSSSCTLISTTPKLHRCRLPEASSKLDFEKLSKTSWYSGLQSNDITASMLSCIRLSNFTSTESGYRVVVKEHGIRYLKFELHFNWHKEGYYDLSKSDKEDNHDEHMREMNGLHNERVSDMDNFLGGGHDVHMTDYKNYIASFVCPPGGISDKEHQMI
ncbi:uncharacterized protein LOC120346509 [Styela clava]